MASEPPQPFLRLERDREGGLMLVFSDGPGEREFPAWALDLARRAGGAITREIDTAEARLRELEVEGQTLTFLYSRAHGTFLMATTPAAEPVLRSLAQKLEVSLARIGPGERS
ncbi:MAG: hypothetical protein MJE66_08160 [Proteobacteria bacterium]|nr:hypothetical protein [Pseudomonadota bacterium]